MGPIRRQLLDMILRDDRYDLPAAELEPLRLEAAREYFAERREQIAVLRRRADDTGVTEIRSFEDIVPLLFSHTVYKSYPQNLVEQGKWAALGSVAQDAFGRRPDHGRRVPRRERRRMDRHDA